MPNAYKLIGFQRNINGNRRVKFLECDYLLVQWCVKLTLVSNFASILFTLLLERGQSNKTNSEIGHY